MKHRNLLLVLGIVSSMSAVARDFEYTYEGQTLMYTVIDEDAKTCETKAGSNPTPGNNVSGVLVIPEKVNDGISDYTVTSVGDFAFNYCYDLTSVEIPNSVTSIGESAFSQCGILTSVMIPNSVTSIGEYAFAGCGSLTSIEIPNSVTSIKNHTFEYCSNLTSIEIPNSVTSIEEYAFYQCNSLTSVVIPNSVTSIGDFAFSQCNSLTSVVIPNSVTSIGDAAFSQCYSLTSVEIPNSVTSIGEYAFSYCSSLTSVIIPPSVTSISEYAFYCSRSLVKCAYPNHLQSLGSNWIPYNPEGAVIEDGFVFGPDKSAIYFAPFALDGDYSIPNSVTSIGERAFEGCSSLTSIEIPNSVTTIGEYAFYNSGLLSVLFNAENCETCRDAFPDTIESLVIGDNVTHIPAYAFQGLHVLTSVEIPNSVTSIGDGAFSYCWALTSINIPSSVTSISDDLFSECPSLASIEIPSSVTSIGRYAFCDCRALTSIEIPNSVTSIGYRAFVWCHGLTSLIIPPSVTSVDNDAFIECDNLVRSAYPNHLQCSGSGHWIAYNPKDAFIEDGFVFGRDKSEIYFTPLTLDGDYTIPSSVKSIGPYAFSNCSDLSSIYMSDSVNEIGESAFESAGLTSIEIPASVTSIGSRAFAGCDRLEKVKVMAELPPVTAEGAFEGLYGNTELSVPSGALGNYLAGNWSLFDKISVAESGQMLKDYSDDLLTYRLDPYGRAAFIKSGQYASSVSIPTSVNLNGDGVYFVKGIGYKAFDGVRIGDVVFSSDSRLESIGEYAFQETRITSLNLPSTVERVHAYAFSGCDRMRTATFGSSLKSIGDYAFQGFNGLQKVVLPPSLETIGDYAFAYSPSLTTVTMGHNVKSIGNYAFCESPVVVIYITAPQPPMADNNTFSNYNANLWLPDKDAVAAYFDAPSCWYRFHTFEMIEPTGIEMTGDKKIDGVPGQQIQLTAVLQPGNVTLSAVFWRSTNPAVATVDANGLVTLSSGNGGMQTRSGEDSCMIIAESLYADGPIVEVPVHVEGLGVDEIESDGFGDSIDYTRPYEVYNMSGLKVADSTDGLTNGLYIIRQGSAAVKTMVR